MNVDMKKNEEYYKSEDSLPCDCACCQNYAMRIGQEYPEIVNFLASIKVDATRPMHLSCIELSDDKEEYLICQYVVFGDCEDDFIKHINDIEISKSFMFPSIDIEDEFFVLDFGPIVLEFDMENIDMEIGKENNYVRDKRKSKFSYLFRKSCGR